MSKLILAIVIAAASFTDSVFYTCSNTSPVTNKKIRAVRLSYLLPFSNWTDKLEDKTKIYDVFYYKDLIMRKVYYNWDSLFNHQLVYSEKRYELFIYHKDSIVGHTYYLYPQQVALTEPMKLDSMLVRNSFESDSFDDLVDRKTDSTYYDNGDLVNVYTVPLQKGDYTTFTTYLYYSENMVGIEETFSKKMDRIPGEKLYKIRVVPHKEIAPGYPKKDIVYEMKEIPVDNEEMILGYFDRYEKEYMKTAQ